MNVINYFAAVAKVKEMQSNSVGIQSLLKSVLESNSKVESWPAYVQLNQDYCSLRLSRRQMPFFKQLFENYLIGAKANLSPEDYLAFLRYLSLYTTGKLPHEVFIRVFLKFFPKENIMEQPLVQHLPSFLSGLRTCSFFTSEMCNLTATVNEKLALESVLGLTVGLNSSNISKSVSKCLACLSSGLIAQESARTWLLVWCKPEVVERMGEISDFSYFHPSRFPHELILCPNFISHDSSSSVCQKFLDHVAAKRVYSTFKPVSCELLLLKMRGIRKRIKELNERSKVSAQDLYFIYGEEVDPVVRDIQIVPSVVVERLSLFYEESREVFERIYRMQMSRLSPSNVEYRMMFRKLMSREYVGFIYSLVGTRSLPFGTRHLVEITLALVNDFACAYFEDESRDSVCRGLETVSAVFQNSESVYVVYNRPLYALVYLSHLARMISESGEISNVNVYNHSLDCEQSSEYGKALAALPKALKNTEVSLRQLFGDTVMQHVDIVLARCVRMLYSFAEAGGELPLFPEFWPNTALITTVQAHQGESCSLVCRTMFSPCFTEIPEEDVSEASQSS